MNDSNSTFDRDFFDPKKLVSLLQNHIWTLLFCILLSVSAAYYVVNYYLLPVYQSDGTMLIKENQDSLPGTRDTGEGTGSGVGDIISRSFTLNSGNTIQSAIYLFKSRELAAEVAKNLESSFNSENARRYPVFWTNYPEDSSIVTVDRVESRIRDGLTVKPVEPESDLLDIRNPNLLNISFRSYSPQEAADVVNLALEVFRQISLEQKQEIADKALSFLEEKKNEIQEQLNDAEDRLISYKNENQLVAIDAQADNSVNTLSQLQAEQQNLEIQLESVNASINNYEEQIEAIKPGLADQYSNAIGPTIENYQQRLADLRTRRFVLLSNNPQLKENPNSEPQLKKLNQQISELEKEIQILSEDLRNDTEGYTGTGDGNLAQELSNIRQNLIQLRIEKNQYESQIEALNRRINEADSFLDTYPDKQVKLARLETEVQRHKQLLNNIISQESEIALWQQTQNSSGTVIDQAFPRYTPVEPNKILWIGFAAMLGFTLPIGLLFIKKSFSSVIDSSEQLKAYPYPLLSVVYDHSLLKSSDGILKRDKNTNNSKISPDIVSIHNSDTPIAESYRKIVSHILYTDPDFDLQTILITSSGQGEGKTTLTANLGVAFTEVDKKVLIIDCDFRRPAMNKLFSLKNTLGLNETIFDKAKLSEAIQETGIPKLFLLPTGEKPDSPAQLLASQKFKEMMRTIKPHFDIILFDTPPQGLVSDVTSLVNQSDLQIVVAKFGETNVNVLNHTLDELNKNEKSNLSLVLTCYKPAKSYDTYDTKGMHKYMYQQYYEYEKVGRKI